MEAATPFLPSSDSDLNTKVTLYLSQLPPSKVNITLDMVAPD
jgi:hypothetical protein